MKILVVGNGARESALLWKLNKDNPNTELYCLPGNGGTAIIAENVDIDIMDNEEILAFAIKNNIDITLVGPEAPLVNGIVDCFRKKGLAIIGADSVSAQLEGSKTFAKAFMEKYSIPTAKYWVYTDYKSAFDALKNMQYPFVIKADGLAGGKGVIIVQNENEAKQALNALFMERQFGSAGDKIVYEEFLTGTESSLICLIDGETIVQLEGARDYKRAYDDDKGLNTGGMGCFSPSSIISGESIQQEIQNNILKPFLKGIKAENMDFRGILFIGLMISPTGVKVLEFNVRFGDPETEVLMPRLKTPMIDILQAINSKNLNQIKLEWERDVCVGVVLAAEGYPQYTKKGDIINIFAMKNNSIIFYGGVSKANNKLITSSGRVMVIANTGKDFETAREKVYADIASISFNGLWYRKDIADTI